MGPDRVDVADRSFLLQVGLVGPDRQQVGDRGDRLESRDLGTSVEHGLAVREVAVEAHPDQFLPRRDGTQREVQVRDVAVDVTLAVLAGRDELCDGLLLVDLDVEHLDGRLGDWRFDRRGRSDARLVVGIRELDHRLEGLAALGLGQTVDCLERPLHFADDVHDPGDETLEQTRTALDFTDVLFGHDGLRVLVPPLTPHYAGPQAKRFAVEQLENNEYSQSFSHSVVLKYNTK